MIKISIDKQDRICPFLFFEYWISKGPQSCGDPSLSRMASNSRFRATQRHSCCSDEIWLMFIYDIIYDIYDNHNASESNCWYQSQTSPSWQIHWPFQGSMDALATLWLRPVGDTSDAGDPTLCSDLPGGTDFNADSADFLCPFCWIQAEMTTATVYHDILGPDSTVSAS